MDWTRKVNPVSRKKITKNTHAGRGPETKWEIPIKQHEKQRQQIFANRHSNFVRQ